jgi:Phosphotransferase enzyme family
MKPPSQDIDRMTRALGWRPTSLRAAAPARGTSGTAARWIVEERAGGAGRSAFVKIGATDLTADWIRREHLNYRSITGWFMPGLLGFDDDGERPTLALEDLSAADWPPPWSDRGVQTVLDVFEAIHMTPAPGHLADLPNQWERVAHWDAVERQPDRFLALRLCSRAWLTEALPALREAATAAPLDGESLIHGDMRSDNLCFRQGRARVIDWNHAQRANPDFDIAAWLPSLHAEGGPPPEAVLPDQPELAAWLAGYFCARAGEPPIPDAPHVRPLQLAQARTALPWAARALGLPEPAGSH